MADSALMDVFYTRQKLLIELAGLALLKSLVRYDVIEELPIGAVLHYQKELYLGFNNL